MNSEHQITLTIEAASAIQDLLKEQEKEDLTLRVYIAGVG
jgi:Fe-S cluster assembly iron-binding protein IscA